MNAHTGARRDTVLEALPDDVLDSIARRDAWRKDLASRSEGLEFIISDLARWPPGGTVRVAFLEGDPGLHGKIVEATEQISSACNVRLDFGRDRVTGEYRRWSESDIQHAAEIRVSFDQQGYFSLVGTDSKDRNIGSPTGLVGGRAGQRSLNLGGFDVSLPAGWQGTVRHEFLHALAFHHAHQNMRGPCENEFRWEDDAGYVPTQDARGVFIQDAAGRRPGIYTYLSGPPNEWDRTKVDRNLKTEEDPNAVAGPFDRASVMLYQFDDFFYKSPNSDCAPDGPGIDLSEGDKRGLRLLYPHSAQEVAAAAAPSARALERLGAEGSLESATDGSTHEGRLMELIRERAASP